jgi:hypothetical protein
MSGRFTSFARRSTAAAVLTLGALATFESAGASARGADGPVGAADFRTAPVLGDGRYSDSAIPAETVWYAFRVTDAEQPISLVATIDDARIDERLDLVVSLVGPDLVPVAESSDGRISQTLVFDRAGGGRSAVWYAAVRTTAGGGSLTDVVVAFTLELAGADAADVAVCSAGSGCPSATDAERLLADIEQMEADLTADAARLASTGRADPLDDTARLALHERRRELEAELDERRPPMKQWPKGVVLGVGVAGVLAGFAAIALVGRRTASGVPLRHAHRHHDHRHRDDRHDLDPTSRSETTHELDTI